MTTTAERLRSFWGERGADRERAGSLVLRYWQVVLIVALIGLGAGLRLWDLGDRSIHHDESIHVKFSYDIQQGGIDEYKHDPTYHGPFQYVAIVTGFTLFGDSHYTGRLAPALFGIALVGLPFLLRRQLGTTGAFVAAGLLAVSPVILYVSRFAREDMYVVFFTLAIAVCMWRYLAERPDEEATASHGLSGWTPAYAFLALLGAVVVGEPLGLFETGGAQIKAAILGLALFGAAIAALLGSDTQRLATGERVELESPVRPWERSLQGHNLWLIAIAPLIALSYATKEITPITVAIFLVFVNFLVAWDLLDQFRATRSLDPTQIAITYVGLALTAWIIVAIWPLIADGRRRFGMERLPAAGAILIIIGTLTAPQFAAAIQELPRYVDKLPLVGDDLVSALSLGGLGDAGYMGEPVVMRVTALVLILGSAYVGLLWNWRVWLVAAVLFYAPFVVLFTSFFTNMEGFWTGLWGSMDYWLEQQGVRRGNQPDYYYFILTPVYEFLPLVFALGGTAYYALRGRLEQKLLAVSALLLIFVFSIIPGDTPVFGAAHIQIAFLIAIAAVLLLSMDLFTKFLLFWLLSIFFALTIAGEKMPWLSVHIALPLALLAAKVVDELVSSFAARAAAEPMRRAKGRLLEAQVPLGSPWAVLGATVALALLAALIFQNAGPASGLSVLAWLFALAATGLVVWFASRATWQAAGQVAAIGLFAALMVFTLRASGYAAFEQGDFSGPEAYPQELLIYAQGSPMLGVLADEIDRQAELSGQGHDLKIYVDNSGNIWPWPWYLREYRNVEYTTFESDFTPPQGSVVLISQSNQPRIQPYLEQYQEPIPYTHMWWFPEFYRGLDSIDFLGDALTGHYLSTWRTYFIDRTVPGASSGQDMFAYFPTGFVTDVPPPVVMPGDATGDLLPAGSVIQVGAAGTGEGQFAQPADVHVDANGNVYVVDSLNQRIQRIAPDGTVTMTGEAGSEDGQFADPFVPDEYENHDGPWGVGVDPDGNVYVADTWNHRIQKFDANLQFVMAWGVGELFGPRDVAIHPDGSVLVVDTGNKKIKKYSPDGGLIAEYGSEGDGPGQYNEPTSISVAPSGEIYVADYWNQRVQHFNSEMQYINEFGISSWGSRGITDRAYIAATADGHVLATDPANGRVAVFDTEGEEIASWLLTASGLTRPVGITIGADEQVYITDGLASNVVRVALSALIAPPSPPVP